MDLGKKNEYLGLGLEHNKNVQSILESGTKSRKKSHYPSGDPTQTPIPKATVDDRWVGQSTDVGQP